MTPLPTQFKGRADQRGYVFTQIKRTGDVALFEKHNPTHPPGTLPSYEVVIVQKHPDKAWPDGRVTQAHESMPSPEEWGVLAYSPPIGAAHAKFDEVARLQNAMP